MIMAAAPDSCNPEPQFFYFSIFAPQRLFIKRKIAYFATEYIY
jgi:hypothetical protein